LEKRAYKNQFLHFLSTGQEKYESCYSQKSRVHNMGFEQKEYVDGCAIFYKSDLLKPLLVGVLGILQIIRRVSVISYGFFSILERRKINLCSSNN